jgi:hypothetical protein
MVLWSLIIVVVIIFVILSLFVFCLDWENASFWCFIFSSSNGQDRVQEDNEVETLPKYQLTELPPYYQ